MLNPLVLTRVFQIRQKQNIHVFIHENNHGFHFKPL